MSMTIRIGLALALGVAAGCSSSSTVMACVPGRVDSCPCLGGAMGVQTCSAAGTYGACTCPDNDGGTADASMDAGLGPDSAAPPDAFVDDAYAPDAFVADLGTDAGRPDAGPIHGHAVLIGWEAYVADDALDPEIVNSVFLSERLGPLTVLEYTAHSEFVGWDVRTRVRALIDAEAARRGRTVTYSDLHDPTMFSAMIATADVFLVYPQPHGASSTFDTEGAGWHDGLVAWLGTGGVTVVLTSRDVHEEWRLVSGASLFNSTMGATQGLGRDNVEVVMPSDPIVAGVISPYPPPSVDGVSCFPGMTGGVVVARSVATAITMPSLCPTVRHITR